MGLPIEHATLLRQQDFVLPPTTGLADGEHRLLVRYGRWLEALSSGRIQPLTPEQEHFVEVARGRAAPTTEFERVWVKYSQVRPRAVAGDEEQAQDVGPPEVASRLR